MAKIILSSMVADIQGRIKGTVYQRTQSGLVARSQPGIINRSSIAQQINKASLVSLQQTWRSLTAADIASWGAYATYRNISQHHNLNRKISGHQIFLYENMVRASVSPSISFGGNLQITVPTISDPPLQIEITSVTNTGTELNVLFDRAINAGNSFLVLKMSRPLTNSQQSAYYKTKIIQFTQSTNDTFDVKTIYESVYGRSPSVGENVIVECAIGSKTQNPVSNFWKQRLTVV